MSSYPGPEPFAPPPPPRGNRGLHLSSIPAGLPEMESEYAPARKAARALPGGALGLTALLALVAAVLIPLGLGVLNGLQERQDYLHRQAISHFQQALAYESENYNELAVAELEIAVKFDPSYQPAQDKLQALKEGDNANGTPVPESQAIADQLYQRAQAAIGGKQWSDAIDYLEEIRRADENFRADEIKTLLIQAYVEGGKESVAAGQIDQAAARFESAFNLDPNNDQVKTLRDRAALYVTGIQSLSTNPQYGVVQLQQLYQQDPNFGDIKTQLLNGYLQYGDAAFKVGSYCVAAREYEQASNLGAAVGSKLTQASASCKQAVLATATPVSTPVTTGTPPVVVPLGSFTVQARADTAAACEGIGGVSGTVRNAAGNPIAGVSVRIYNDIDYKPSPFKTDANGRYSIVLGKDAGLFHLVVLGANGQPASGVYDLQYPGGLTAGCRWEIDWIKNP